MAYNQSHQFDPVVEGDDVGNQPSLNSIWAYRHLLDVEPPVNGFECQPSQSSIPMSVYVPEVIPAEPPIGAENDALRAMEASTAPLNDVPQPVERKKTAKAKTPRKKKSSISSKAQATPTVFKLFRCTLDPFCEMQFTRAEHLARHERKHTKEKPFVCHCSKAFSRLDNWRQHKVSVHKDDVEENVKTEKRLVQVHKEMQRENNIRKAAALAAQRKQEAEMESAASNLPADSIPPETTSSHQPSLTEVTRNSPHLSFSESLLFMPNTPFTYSEPNTARMMSNGSTATPVFDSSSTPSSTYAHSGGSKALYPDLFGSSSPPALPYNTPYSMPEYQPTVTSSSYSPYSSSAYLSPVVTSASMDTHRGMSHVNGLPGLGSLHATPQCMKKVYPQMLMEPFNIDAGAQRHSNPHLSNPFQPLQPLQSSRKLNMPSNTNWMYGSNPQTFQQPPTTKYSDPNGIYHDPPHPISSSPVIDSTRSYLSPDSTTFRASTFLSHENINPSGSPVYHDPRALFMLQSSLRTENGERYVPRPSAQGGYWPGPNEPSGVDSHQTYPAPDHLIARHYSPEEAIFDALSNGLSGLSSHDSPRSSSQVSMVTSHDSVLSSNCVQNETQLGSGSLQGGQPLAPLQTQVVR